MQSVVIEGTRFATAVKKCDLLHRMHSCSQKNAVDHFRSASRLRAFHIHRRPLRFSQCLSLRGTPSTRSNNGNLAQPRAARRLKLFASATSTPHMFTSTSIPEITPIGTHDFISYDADLYAAAVCQALPFRKDTQRFVHCCRKIFVRTED